MEKPLKTRKKRPTKRAPDDANATNHKVKSGYRLMQAISALGKTQIEIATEFDVSTSRLGHWVRGLHYPDPYFVYRFCQAYSVTADWIYRGVIFGLPASLADGLSQQKLELSAIPAAQVPRVRERSVA